MKKFLLTCISVFWSGVTVLYALALYDKITKPPSKDLGVQGYTILGCIIASLWILIYFAYKKNRKAIH